MLTEQIVLDDGTEAGMWMTATNKVTTLPTRAITLAPRDVLHHVTFALDAREDVLRAADVFLENGVLYRDRTAQTCDPADLLSLCVRTRRKSGSRCPAQAHGLSWHRTGSRSRWTEAERKKGQAWGLQTIKSFHTKGTPPIAGVPDS